MYGDDSEGTTMATIKLLSFKWTSNDCDDHQLRKELVKLQGVRSL